MTIDATSRLLAEVFPGSRISRPDYLRWLYEDSPYGRVVEANLDDELGRAGHYALVPIDLVVDGRPRPGALSLNTAVHERARGGGVFVRLARETYETAERERGIQATLGVGNANSTHGLVKRLGFRLVGPLPATVLLPAPGSSKGVRSAWATPAAFASGGPAADAEDLLRPPSRGIARPWTPETLRWRVASPGVRYGLHRMPDALVLTTADRRHGVPVAIILKIFAPSVLGAADRRAIVRAACRFHRAPVALHVGFNEHVAFRGLPLPARLRDSPLNLVRRGLDDVPDGTPFPQFEFLDFDAY